MYAVGPLILALVLLNGNSCSSAQGQKAAGTAQQDESPESIERSRREVRRILRAFSDGYEGRSPRRVIEQLDERFDDLPRFEDLVTEFLRDSAEMRLFLRESTAEVKGDRAVLQADAEMVFSLKADPQREQRRKQRVQFDFARTEKGWKIYEVSPRSFFTP